MYKIGTKLKIKTVVDMCQEFGVDIYGGPDVMFGYPFGMEAIMPDDRIIEITGVDCDGDPTWEGYSISTDMVEAEVE